MNQLRTIVQGEKFKHQLSLCIPKNLNPEVLQRVALTAMNKTPGLADCTPESICSCLLDLAACGLVPDGRRSHLIPRGNQCTLVIDYKGYVEICYRNPDVAKVQAEVICEGDTFAHDRGEISVHTWDATQPRGEICGAYAEVVFRSGARVAAILSLAEIHNVRDASAHGTDRASSPWVRFFGEMAKKTAIRRLMKMIPLPAESAGAIAADGESLEVEHSPARRIETRSEPVDLVEAARARAERDRAEIKGDTPKIEGIEIEHEHREAEPAREVAAQRMPDQDDDNLI